VRTLERLVFVVARPHNQALTQEGQEAGVLAYHSRGNCHYVVALEHLDTKYMVVRSDPDHRSFFVFIADARVKIIVQKF
jgi:hypothetical protein